MQTLVPREIWNVSIVFHVMMNNNKINNKSVIMMALELVRCIGQILIG